MRDRTIRQGILEILERIEPYALPEAQLYLEINGRIRPPVGQAEFDDAINWLCTNKHIAVMEDNIDPQVKKWLITETGKTLLRK